MIEGGISAGSRVSLCKIVERLGRTLLLLMFFALSGISAAQADTRVALVVANSDYTGAPLANPTVDAGLVAPALKSMGFDVTEIANADLATFDQAINDFTEKARGADLAVFYFAGHGFALNNGIQVQSYLMSTSADVTAKSDRVIIAGGIPLDVIASQITAVARTTLIFVDACRNDPRVRATGNTGRGLAPVGDYVTGDVFIGLSTRIGDTATDGAPGQGSPFARAFVANMTEPGLSVDRAFNKVRLQVEQETGSQRPEAQRVDLQDPDKVILMASLEDGSRSLSIEPAGDNNTASTTSNASSTTGGTAGGAHSDPKVEEARVTWDSIKDTSSVAILRRFAETYDGTVYSSFASARADELAGIQQPVSIENDAAGVESDGNSETDVASLPTTIGDSRLSVPGAASSDPCDKEAVGTGVLGAGEDPNYIEASEAISACLLSVSLHPGDHFYEFQLGRAYDVSGDLAAAMPWYELAAKGGIVEAMAPLAYIYELGEVVGQDFDRARYWYEQAAKHDIGYALQNLGFMYENGKGVAQDRDKARGLLERAAEQGEVNAILMMAYYYFNGEGVEVDHNLAYQYYAQAAAANAPDGLYMMGYMLRDGLGVRADPAKAREWFQLATEQDNTLAMHSLALLLDAGTGGPRDPSQAAQLMVRALELGQQFTYDQLTTNSAAFSAELRRELQRQLREKGLFTGKLDGEFGTSTVAAIDALMTGTQN